MLNAKEGEALLDRLTAIRDKLGESLSKRESETARVASEVWSDLNDELVRLSRQIKADPFQELHDAMDGWS